MDLTIRLIQTDDENRAGVVAISNNGLILVEEPYETDGAGWVYIGDMDHWEDSGYLRSLIQNYVDYYNEENVGA